MNRILSLDDLDLNEKKVLLRLDINAPIDPITGNIADRTRLEKSLHTMNRLKDEHAAVAIIAHQGDTLDYQNLISMREHAKILTELFGTKIEYIEDVCGPAAVEAVRRLQPGEWLLLGNLRYLSEEISTFETVVKLTPEAMTKTWLVRTLAPLFDVYVNDAFSAAHRNCPSMVAFQRLLPSAAGDLLFAEYQALSRILNTPQHPSVFVLGGAKISDAFGMIAQVLANQTADMILTAGVVGQVFLLASGISLGQASLDFLSARNLLPFVEEAKDYLEKYGKRIVMPSDLAYEKDGVRHEVDVGDLPIHDALFMDVGQDTVTGYKDMIGTAQTLFVNGPAGVYEDARFSYGTQEIWSAIADAKGYSVMGGGDSLRAANQLIDSRKIDYQCTAGGAMVRFMTGKTLPLIRAMEDASRPSS